MVSINHYNKFMVSSTIARTCRRPSNVRCACQVALSSPFSCHSLYQDLAVLLGSTDVGLLKDCTLLQGWKPRGPCQLSSSGSLQLPGQAFPSNKGSKDGRLHGRQWVHQHQHPESLPHGNQRLRRAHQGFARNHPRCKSSQKDRPYLMV